MMTPREIRDVIRNVKFDEYGMPTNLECFNEVSNDWLVSNATEDLLLQNILVEGFTYRIKSELKYVPYDETDALELLGKTFVDLSRDPAGRYLHVAGCSDVGVTFAWRQELYTYGYEYLFRNYTKLDGTPAGKLKEASNG